MAVRLRIIHREKVGAQITEYRADILDSAYSGSVHEVLARDSFFDWDYDIIEPRRVMDTPVQKSGFTVNLLLDGELESNLMSDIIDADEVRFQIIFYINGDAQWYGNVLTDLIEYDENEYKGVGRIRAKDLTILEGKDYPIATVATRTRLIEIIAECLLQTGHSLPIRTFTNLTHANANIDQDADFLYAIYHQKLAFQNQTNAMTCMDVLENICRAYNLIIRQGAGRWVIEQLPAVARGNAWQFDYNANGGSPSTTQNPARAIPIDDVNSFVIPGTMNRITGALKSITSTYNHRTKLDPFELPSEVIQESEFANPEEFARDINLTTGDTVQFKAQAQVTVADPASFMTGTAFVRIVAVRSEEPDLYMTQSGGFQTAPASVGIPVSGGSATLTGSLNLTGTIGTITRNVTRLRILFLWAEAQEVSDGPQKTVTQVKYINPELIAGEPERDWSASSSFSYTREGNYSVTEEIRPTVLGDGPQSFSKGIPAWSTLTSSDLSPGFFRIRGVSETVNLQEITLRERMNMRRAPMRMLQSNLMMRFSPANLVNYDGRSWFFLGGHFEANGSQWRADLLSFDYLAEVGDDFADFTPPPPGGTPGRSDRFTLQMFAELFGIGVITDDVNGLVDELPVRLFTQAREGNVIGLIDESIEAGLTAHIRREDSYDEDDLQRFDAGDHDLPIIEQFLQLPEGTIVTLSGIQLQSYFHVDPGRILGVVEKEKVVDAIGTLSADRSGTITTIALKDIDEQIELDDGQVLRITNKTGGNEQITVDGDQVLSVPEHTINIIEKTLTNEYTAGYAWVREPVYKLTGRLNITAGLTELNQTAISDQGTAIAGLTLDVTGINTSIVNLESHVNIAGGSAFSALNMRNEIQTNEQTGITNATSITNLNSHVNLAGGSAFSSLNMRNDITTNTNTNTSQATSITNLNSHVNLAGGSSFSALNMRNDINTNTSTNNSQATSITNLSSHVNLAGGSAFASLNMRSDITSVEGRVTTAEATAVLKVDAQGRIASVALSANHNSSTITIRADQIDINNINFDPNGNIRSSNFNGTISSGTITANGTAGWAIDRNGFAVFNNVTVRNGSIISPAISGSGGTINDINIISGDIQCGSNDVRFAAVTQATGPGSVNPLRIFANTAQVLTGGGRTAYALYWVRPN